MYFKGNGHLTGRNGAYDRVPNVQRYFYIPALENGVDVLKWIDGFSVCWQIIPVKQAAYYTTFFYSASQGTNFYDLLDKNGYVGCHPYPHSAIGQAGDDFKLHKWEISVDGGDYVSDLVPYGQTRTQAFKCSVLNKTTGQSALRFYQNINSTTAAGQTKTEQMHSGLYAKSAPHPFKAMVFGNAPWWQDHQHERLSGFIRRIKIFSGELSDDDLMKESLSDSLVTTAGRNLIWWAKVNPQNPDDLTSDFASALGQKRIGKWIDNSRCEIVNGAQLATHHAFKSANTIGDLLHMERG